MKRLVLFILWMSLGLGTLVAQNPWLGGLNACQFGRMDLDDDGQKDLLVFDRHGSRLLCFLNRGGEGEIEYQYTSAYDSCFPPLCDWAIFADYDGDGHEDIFTYSKGWAGIMVYRNTALSGVPGFQRVVYPYLTSWQGGGEVNVLATNADYPSIVDLDGDGDLDLLTFGVMGTFLEKHVNLSMERYGCLDSLVFERTDQCWGRVGESEEDNVMYLDTCLFGYGVKMDPTRHRGATVTVKDLTGDGLLDLLLADVDYPGLTCLLNGGDSEQALMVSQSQDFPRQDPVCLFSMPVPFFTDVNNDGKDDLLVSPFAPDPMACEGRESLWLYLNHGSNQHPDYRLHTKSFLQDSMVDVGTGAYPIFVDWDGDGLRDLVVGTIGNIDSTWYHYGSLKVHRSAKLWYYRNIGESQSPVFQLIDDDFLGLGASKMTGLSPTFADLNGDGLPEMLLGTSEGRLLLYAHDGSLLDGDYLHYRQPWSVPCFFDVDDDGRTDLVVGNASGRLSFYVGGVEWVTDDWGGVDVRDYATSYYGYSVPSLFKNGDEILLSVGSESGKVFLFEGLTADGNVVFPDVSSRWQELCGDMPATFGMRSAPAVTDLEGNGLLDVLVGSFAGGLRLFNAEIPVVNYGTFECPSGDGLVVFPNPVSSQLRMVSKDDNLRMLTVVDLYGRTLVERPLVGVECLLDLEDWPAGVYVLRVTLERGVVSRIFLKR